LIRIAIGGVVLAGASWAQSTPPAATQTPAAAPATPAPPAVSPFHQAGMDFSFLLDGYADKNFNNPPSGFNGLQNFDFRANTAHISFGKVTIDRAPAPIGFHLDVGFGSTVKWISSTDRAPEGFRYFEQAYVSVKPKSWKGLEIDLGKFTTSAGAEVIEANANWNYTRSLLFAWALPYYHFGVKTSIPIGKFTGGFQVVQGWNNVYDNNSAKTLGFTGAYAWKKATWSNNYYVGPENTKTNDGIRHLYDTTLLISQTEKLSYYFNFDYGQNGFKGLPAAKWGGFAAATRYAITPKFAVSARGEYFDDAEGFSTGTTQHLGEFTLTGEYIPFKYLITRAEFRNDWSNKNFFENKGTGSKTQPTLVFAMMLVLK
jgi:hypothetical protein